MGCASKFIVLLTAPLPFLILRPRPSLVRLSPHSPISSCLRRHHHHLVSSPLVSNHIPLGIGLSIKASRCFHSFPAALSDDRFSDPCLNGHSSTQPGPFSWPQWSRFHECLSSAGYSDHRRFPVPDGIVFACVGNFPEDFMQVARTCLAFAHNRPDLLGYLSGVDIEVVISNCSPFLFEDAADTTRRMRSFLSSRNNLSCGALESEKACTVDLMKFLVSYINSPTQSMEKTDADNKELIQSSVQNILSELAQVIPVVSTPAPYRQNIEMKRGDWICPSCEFMNFARNVKCLECEEARPPRQLTGGEWECPQCDFFNYGRNMVCLRCDCKRPGQISLGSDSGLKNGNERHPNDEKAERWFNKVSQLDNSSQFNSVETDKDFPEIMPLRKGVNKFVVSTGNAPFGNDFGNDRGISGGNDASDVNKGPGMTVSKRLDEVLGRTYPASNTANRRISASGTNTSPTQPGKPKRSNSSYVPFVPLSPDTFAQKTRESKAHERDLVGMNSSESVFRRGPVSRSNFGTSRELAGSLNKEGQSDENFPESMPERKGDNHFIISNRDQSLFSPRDMRQADTGQENKNNFVPFVPFPPDYFANKDKPLVDGNGIDSSQTARHKSSKFAWEGASEDTESASPPASSASYGDGVQWRGENQNMGTSGQNWGSPRRQTNERNLVQSSMDQRANGVGNFGYSGRENASGASNIRGSPAGSMNNENLRPSWTGKSLEGSAVKEPDPLDMSEEAKAERFFRRAAQIKDISELSQIPDEDFPSIMPMRKGVNRFVVSKRKTPMERRLTSAQYRRNLPVVSSDSVKENKDS